MDLCEGAEQFLRVRHVRRQPAVEVCTPVGEIDRYTLPLLRRVLRDTEQRRVPRVFVDLSGVEFLGVAGVRVLVTAAEHARATARQLGVVVATRPVRRVLEVTAAAEHLVVYSCLPDALAALAVPAPRDGTLR